MAKQLLIGIDIGTQGTKAVLFDAGGQKLTSAFAKSRLKQPRPGAIEEEPEYQVKVACRCIKQCITEARVAPLDVAGIGIDGQMAGVIGIGEDGRNVTPYDSWLDTRCSDYVRKMQQEAGDQIIRKTGGPASFNHGPKILWWKHKRPDLYEKIVSFVQPGGYVAMRLCELDASQAFIDPTYLHFSGFADNQAGQWDGGLCRQFGLSVQKLPRIVEPHAVVGQLTASQARRCGLKAGVPIIAGCGDTAASFLACGATRQGICVDVAGTASVFAGTAAQFAADTEHRILSWGRSAVPGLWHPYAYINGGGMNIEWFVREFADSGQSKNAQLARLGRLAAKIEPKADDPLFIPHLGGRVSPGEPNLRGSWANLNWSHGAGHLYRAVMEAVALEYCIYRDVLKSMNSQFDPGEIRITGGGGTSNLWNQIKADALGIPVVRTNRQEGAPMGAALLAGFGVGLFTKLSAAASKWIGKGQRTRPQRQHAAHYRQRLLRYRQLLDHLGQWAESNGAPAS